MRVTVADVEMTMDDLRRVFRSVAGEDEAVDLDVAIDDVDFGDLGYDSLALLEAAREIEREYGVTLADDVVAESASPSALLALVNTALVTTAPAGAPEPAAIAANL
jgi:acyl carrier protein